MRLSSYIPFFLFGTLVLAAPAEPASNLKSYSIQRGAGGSSVEWKRDNSGGDFSNHDWKRDNSGGDFSNHDWKRALGDVGQPLF
ncbi:hypothetical protein DFH94DRAFT_694792 [Russula ochroleuca]|uniref:Uncharacterized protein n=1 Tax=Russula ochroleuca TaxID=152965 RepID=A0A9P5MS53_9AGAM|nr:hypothetical protein DFH94DRAFT_694792 [Russula ochroleuca]